MKRGATWIAVEAIRFVRKFGGGVCRHRVEELRVQLENGADMEPIRVNALGDGTFTVKDGRHRAQAYIAAGYSQILAYIENLPDIARRIIRSLCLWRRFFI